MAKVHTCTVCGAKGLWGDSWSWYGSINHMDTCPDDIPTACSDKCARVMAENIKSGKWVLPELGSCGAGGARIIRDKRGY